jgi:hypothetical protein
MKTAEMFNGHRLPKVTVTRGRAWVFWNGIDRGAFFGHIPKLYCRVYLQAWQLLGFAPVEPVFFFNT